MTLGTIVQYTSQEGEEPYAAIITRVWPEGLFGLYVFNHDITANVRAVHPHQIHALRDETQLQEIIEEFVGLGQRLANLENELEELRFSIQRMKPAPEAPEQEAAHTALVPGDWPIRGEERTEPETEPETGPLTVQLEPEPKPKPKPEIEAEPEPVPVAVESTRGAKRRAAWPR